MIPIPVFFVADGEPKPLGATTSGEPSPVTPPVDGKEAEELPPATKRVKREGTGRGSGGSAGPGEGGRRVGCVCYVCEVPPLPGKFDVKKAVALGVPMVSYYYYTTVLVKYQYRFFGLHSKYSALAFSTIVVHRFVSSGWVVGCGRRGRKTTIGMGFNGAFFDGYVGGGGGVVRRRGEGEIKIKR